MQYSYILKGLLWGIIVLALRGFESLIHPRISSLFG